MDTSSAPPGHAGSTVGLVARFERFAVHDGPGIRTVVYLKGCPLRCPWCHSPETQSCRPELALRSDRCLRCGTCLTTCTHDAVVLTAAGFGVRRDVCRLCGDCTAACPTGARELVGRAMSVAEVVRELERDVVFYDQSNGGVTISGGEPLLQPEFLEELVGACRARRLHTAVETCGLGETRALLRVARNTDLFLYDLKLLDDGRHVDVTGRSNDRILENLRRLVERGATVRVRFPFVPGLSDDASNLAALGAFVSSLGLTGLDLLPYHRAGIARYARLDRAYPLPEVAAPPAEAIDAAVGRLRRFGLNVHVGGGP